MLIRAVLLPARLAVGLTRLGVRTGFAAGRLSVGTSYRVGRRVGWSRLAALGTGVVIGMMIAPSSGAELRARLGRRVAERRRPVGDDAVAARVRYELSHSPRTWHLPQPEVEVAAGVAVLTGAVPHEEGRADIERTVGAVPGVTRVDNRLVVAPRDGAAGPS
ncbi:MAG TPA: BON domain-containing protein [Acidimicrobiales bacterium]|jgi:hypothetical protein|nr:BON domain-containing protein [Acidimicrobiales bacterium]